MIYRNDWLWDRNITVKKAKVILKNPDDSHFLNLAGLLLSRKNTPKEIFKDYLSPIDFFKNWERIKRQMRKDDWNNPRIEFWQAIYEKVKEKYHKKGILPARSSISAKPQDKFCKLIGDKIMNMRKQKGLTQAELANKLKVSQQMVSYIESGKENFSLLTLKKIAENLGGKLEVDISD